MAVAYVVAVDMRPTNLWRVINTVFMLSNISENVNHPLYHAPSGGFAAVALVNISSLPNPFFHCRLPQIAIGYVNSSVAQFSRYLLTGRAVDLTSR